MYYTGQVVFLHPQKGYGFIKDNSSDAEYYFKENRCLDIIQKGDSVKFIIVEAGDGKISAQKVEKI